MKDTYYPLGDAIPAAVARRLREKGLEDNRDNIRVRARTTGQMRPPSMGEWYLSGANVHAYRASSDLPTAYHIAELVVIKVKTIEHQTLITIIK